MPIPDKHTKLNLGIKSVNNRLMWFHFGVPLLHQLTPVSEHYSILTARDTFDFNETIPQIIAIIIQYGDLSAIVSVPQPP